MSATPSVSTQPPGFVSQIYEQIGKTYVTTLKLDRGSDVIQILRRKWRTATDVVSVPDDIYNIFRKATEAFSKNMGLPDPPPAAWLYERYFFRGKPIVCETRWELESRSVNLSRRTMIFRVEFAE